MGICFKSVYKSLSLYFFEKMNDAIWNHWIVRVLLFISFMCFDFHLQKCV